jgi:hypothetical protein
MPGIPQMLECYLQLSGRAGTRQPRRNCWSRLPLLHLGGAVVYTNDPT